MPAVHAIQVSVPVETRGPVVLHRHPISPDFPQTPRAQLQQNGSRVVSRREKDAVAHHDRGGGIDGFIAAGAEWIAVQFPAVRRVHRQEAPPGQEHGDSPAVQVDDGRG